MAAENSSPDDGKNEVTEVKKEKGQSPIVKIAKGFRKSKSVVKYAGGAVLAVGALAVAVPFLGTVMLCSLAIGAVAFIATMIMAIQYARKNTPMGEMLGPLFAKTAQMMQETNAKQSSTAEAESKETKAKADAPKDSKKKTKNDNKKDTADNAANSQAPREFRLWDLQGHVYIFSEEPTVSDMVKANNGTGVGLFGVPNDTKVTVVLDENNEAVRVRILTGERQGTEGWVCRSSVMSADRLAS